MIARHLAIACLIYVIFTLQPSMPGDITGIAFRPWLPGIVIVGCVLMTDGAASLLWAGLLGLGVDCQSADRLGVHVVVATVVASGMMMVRSDNRSQGVISVIALIFGGTFVWRTAASVAHGLLDRRSIDVTQLTAIAIWEAACSSALSICLLLIAQVLTNAIRPQRGSSVSLGNRWSMLTGR